MDADKKPEDTTSFNPGTPDSLETPETVVEPIADATTSSDSGTRNNTNAPNIQPDEQLGNDTPSQQPASQPPQNDKPEKHGLRERIRSISARFNIYLLLFILVLIITGIAITVTVMQARKNATKTGNNTNGQSLSQSTLQQLSNSDAIVGTSSQTLNVQSNAVFAGQVIIRSNLEVAGTIKVGGALSIPGLSVSGNGTFAQVQTGGLTVSGDSTLQGGLSVQKNLNVSGAGSFGTLSAQQLSVGTLQLNGALVLTNHITAGGPVPRKSDGNALGGGGTSSLSGSDTAGTIAINTGSGPAAGCFVTVTFARAYSGTPRVMLTPVSSAAAGLPYYVSRTSTNFSVCTASPAPAGQNISFDYAIFD